MFPGEERPRPLQVNPELLPGGPLRVDDLDHEIHLAIAVSSLSPHGKVPPAASDYMIASDSIRSPMNQSEALRHALPP